MCCNKLYSSERRSFAYDCRINRTSKTTDFLCSTLWENLIRFPLYYVSMCERESIVFHSGEPLPPPKYTWRQRTVLYLGPFILWLKWAVASNTGQIFSGSYGTGRYLTIVKATLDLHIEHFLQKQFLLTDI